jgi:hypothetical protein
MWTSTPPCWPWSSTASSTCTRAPAATDVSRRRGSRAATRPVRAGTPC